METRDALLRRNAVVRAFALQQLHNMQVFVSARPMQRRATLSVPPVDIHAAVANQILAHCAMTLACGGGEKRDSACV